MAALDKEASYIFDTGTRDEPVIDGKCQVVADLLSDGEKFAHTLEYIRSDLPKLGGEIAHRMAIAVIGEAMQVIKEVKRQAAAAKKP